MSTLINDFKYLHQIPEESFKEFKTHKYIMDELSKLECMIFELKPTGIIAFFNFNHPETIAFRCELDGLPIIEKTNLLHKSTHEGFMHACGHDGHMAILINFAREIKDIKCKKSNIMFIIKDANIQQNKRTTVYTNLI